MKSLACLSFGFFTGVLSAYFGLNFYEDPAMYLMINIPAIVCFGAVISLLDSKRRVAAKKK